MYAPVPVTSSNPTEVHVEGYPVGPTTGPMMPNKKPTKQAPMSMEWHDDAPEEPKMMKNGSYMVYKSTSLIGYIKTTLIF